VVLEAQRIARPRLTFAAARARLYRLSTPGIGADGAIARSRAGRGRYILVATAAVPLALVATRTGHERTPAHLPAGGSALGRSASPRSSCLHV